MNLILNFRERNFFRDMKIIFIEWIIFCLKKKKLLLLKRIENLKNDEGLDYDIT
jgi:hypothetical protein